MFHGLIYANENDTDGIKQVLKDLHENYVPKTESGVYGTQGFPCDQLSVERGVNCIFQSANGFTPEERYSGMHFEVADFHTEMKLTQVCIKKNHFPYVQLTLDLQFLFR